MDRVSFVEFIKCVWSSKIPSGAWLKASMPGTFPISFVNKMVYDFMHISVRDEFLRIFEVIMHISCHFVDENLSVLF